MKIFSLLLFLCLILSCGKNSTTNPLSSPCDNITCLNGGVCETGTCNCPAGFSGTNCEKAVLPSVVNIPLLKITKISSKNANGLPWDNDGGPDIYFKIFAQGNDQPIYTSASVHNNANISLEIADILTTPISISQVSKTCTVQIWDKDGGSDSDDLMDQFTFIPYSPALVNNHEMVFNTAAGTNFKMTVQFGF